MSSRKTASYFLLWKRGNSVLSLPVGLVTSVSSAYESDNLICDECKTIPEKHNETVMKQRYECTNCGKKYPSISYVKLRYNREYEVVYNTDEKKEYLEGELDREITVIKEVSLTDAVLQDVELFNDFNPLEIISNDSEKFKSTIEQVWNFLSEHKVALKVEANYRGDNFRGYIIATLTGKLVLIKLKDKTLLKAPYQVIGMHETLPIKIENDEFVSQKKQKVKSFLEMVKTGVEPEPVIRDEVKPIISETFFD